MSSSFIKEMIKRKIKDLSTNEVLFYANEYGFDLTKEEAENIIHYLKTNDVNPFDANDRMKMIQELAKITDYDTAKKAQQLFIELVKTYGLEGLL